MAQIGDSNISWKLGAPTFAANNDKIRIFFSGTAPTINPNEERRYIADPENWKKANGVWIAKDGREIQLTVTEGILKKDDDYRTWKVVPFTEDGKNGISLIPTFDLDGTQDDLFNGNFARVVDCLILRKNMKKLMDYLNSHEKFGRTSTTSATGNKWGTVSGHLARMHNYGYISELDEFEHFSLGDETIKAIKDDKCKELATRKTRVYEKSHSWGVLWNEWEDFLDGNKDSRMI
ncbi:MAG: hypothetical protein WC708_00255 [Lentisphaeria bacterium]|jgi:hypothetical protein